MSRTDNNNNPAAFTTDIAVQAKLQEGVDYVPGTPFPAPSKLKTAKLLGDPIAITIRVIDAIGYETRYGSTRWSYINIPKFVWDKMDAETRRDVVGYHYLHEGGIAMRHLFPNTFPEEILPSDPSNPST